MNILKRFNQNIKKIPNHPRLLLALVLLSYLVVVAYYMTPQILSPTTTVYGFGDNTAGPIWRYEVKPDNPFWGYENVTNYPFGENLSGPVYASGSVQYVSYWLLSILFGPILAYNILNILGFLLSAMLMYGFIKFVTNKAWIAWLAGYAVAFTPYYQMKVGGHPTYGYQAIFIGIIWLFLKVVKTRRVIDAIFLGIVFSIAFYFDVYLALFATITVLSLAIAWAFVHRKNLSQILNRNSKRDPLNIRKQLSLFVISGITVTAIVLPLVAFFATQHKEINTELAAARGNVVAEAKACSNWPHEYLTPFVMNPFLEKAFGKDRYESTINSLKDNFSCGIGEDSVGLSLTLVSIAAVGCLILAWEKVNKRRIKLTDSLRINPRLLLSAIGVMALLAIAIGFPPLKFHNVIPTPSLELLSLTTTWRTLARAYVLVNIALVIFSSIILAYFARFFAKNKKLLVLGYLAILLGVFIEYQAFLPLQGNSLSNYNYMKDPPVAYRWLAAQKDRRVVAEYPLEREGGESDAGSYYLTMQSTHGKKLFNSALSNSVQDSYKSGLKNLADPQTIPSLRAFGVDTVIVHGVSKKELSSLPGVRVVYEADQSRFNLLSHTPTVKKDNITIIDIREASKAEHLAVLDDGFVRNTNIIHSVVDWEYEATIPSKIKLFAFSRGRPIENETKTQVCFDVKMSVPKERDTLMISVDGGSLAEYGLVTDEFHEIRVSAIKDIAISNKTKHNMRITRVGCDN